MSTTTTSSGTKRKRDTPKFYAVRVGHKPDIYHSWADCQAQVKGCKGAVFKSFSSLHEAEAFLRNDTPKASNGAGQKFYAIQSGRVPGVYTDWTEAQKQITGWKGVKHKSFSTRAEAEAFVAAGKGITANDVGSSLSKDADGESEISIPDGRKGCKVGDNITKKQKKNDGSVATPMSYGMARDYEPGTEPLPPDAEDGFDRSIILNPETGAVEYKSEQQLNAVKLQPTGETKGVMEIYTDGSSLGNGKAGATAGIGVWFGENDPRNVSAALKGTRQTNQRAELTALQRALDIAPIDRDVKIWTDSNYSINCVTIWFQKWRTNGWKNAAGKAIENRDIIEPILNRINERNMCKAKTEFVWLKGHANSVGNNAADELAVNGARTAQVEKRAESTRTNDSIEYE